VFIEPLPGNTLTCHNIYIIVVVKSKEIKTVGSNSRQSWQNLLRKVMAQKELFCNYDDDDDVLLSADRVLYM
jgi:hypothetical protein